MTCPAETTVTGRLGKVQVESTLIARITKWDINPKLASKSEWGDSDSEGYTNRAPGRRDATFNAEGKYDTGAEVFDLFMPGDCATVVLWMIKDDVRGLALYWYFQCALCDDFSMMIDVDTEEVIGWTSAWGANGKFYYPGEAEAPVATYPS